MKKPDNSDAILAIMDKIPRRGMSAYLQSTLKEILCDYFSERGTDYYLPGARRNSAQLISQRLGELRVKLGMPLSKRYTTHTEEFHNENLFVEKVLEYSLEQPEFNEKLMRILTEDPAEILKRKKETEYRLMLKDIARNPEFMVCAIENLEWRKHANFWKKPRK